MKLALSLFGLLLLAGCMPAYHLVKPEAIAVGDGSMSVTPANAWNEAPGLAEQKWEDSWTLNGPLLDSVAFVTGLPEGKALVKQRRKADAQVTPFRADMTPNDLVSMIESSYRVQGVAVFNVEGVDPTPFLGGNGLKLRFSYSPTDGIGRRGSCVMRVVGNKLYLIKYEAVRSHYYEASLPEFEKLVASAELEK
jgi:hypothetical protein